MSLDDAPMVEDIVYAYHAFAKRQRDSGFPPAVPEMEDSVLIAAGADRPDLVQASLSLAIELVEMWSKSRLPLNWTSSQGWLDGLRSRSADPSQVKNVVADQIVKHELGKIRNA